MDFISKFHFTKREKILSILFIIALLFGISQYFSSKQADPPMFTEEKKESTTKDGSDSALTPTDKSSTIEIAVDVKGAVSKPGVYQIKNEARLQDVLSLAGGVLPTADLDQVNLALKLKDEMVVYIPIKGEKVENQMMMQQASGVSGTSNSGGQIGSKININTANETQLMELEGIGETKAKAIIQYREQNGSFKMLEDLMNVSGIGQKTFDKLKENISLH